MKRTLAFLLMMTAGGFAQTPTVVQKSGAKPSAATVKAVPPTAVKAQPGAAAKVSVAPVPKPAAVSIQAAPSKPAAAAPAKTGTVASAKPTVVATSPAKAAAPTQKSSASGSAAVSVKPATSTTKAAVVVSKNAQATKKSAEVKVPAKATAKQTAGSKGATQTTVAVHDSKLAESDKKQAPKAINAVGRRDPFVSPVVNLGAVGSGCSSGKRCLAIDQIALKGVVKSDAGMIAVVVNAMDKAYFLRENDPVFNGYVVKITGDSIVFKETFHDRLGKPLTRDVTKSISRPAV
jgi:hypothetical protein